MRYLVFYILLGSTSLQTQAQEAKGVKFLTGSWKDVLTAAKQANRPVFVDLYTTWCGPCKIMAKQAFPDPNVSQKFNANFISYQLDAEKGEGIDLAKHYAVTAYPTSLYVTGDGDLIYRVVGYTGIKGMIDEANKAIEAAKDPKPLAVYEQEYKGGRRDTTFLHGYLTKRAVVSLPDGEALENYLAAIPTQDWTSDKNIVAISGNLTNSRLKVYSLFYDYAMKIRTQDRNTYGKIMGGIKLANMTDYQRAITSKDVGQLERLIHNEQQYIIALVRVPPTADALDRFTGLMYKIHFYRDMKDWNLYRSMAQREGNQLLHTPSELIARKDEAAYKVFEQQNASMPDSLRERDDFKQYAATMKRAESNYIAMNLNSLAWAYYEMATTAKDFTQALEWSKKSLSYDLNATHLTTYAHLCRKLGRKVEAIKFQKEAIAYAKSKGEDAAEYEKSLAEINRVK